MEEKYIRVGQIIVRKIHRLMTIRGSRKHGASKKITSVYNSCKQKGAKVKFVSKTKIQKNIRKIC